MPVAAADAAPAPISRRALLRAAAGLCLPLAGVGSDAARADDPPAILPRLDVRVLDENGKPLPGATISRGWLWNIEKPDAYSPYNAWRTDANGELHLTAADTRDWPLFAPLSLFVTSADGTRGAATAVARTGKLVEMRLRPLEPVRYALAVPGWEGAEPPSLSVTFAPKGGGHLVTVPGTPSGSLRLPPGRWEMTAQSNDIVTRDVAFTVKPGQATDLGSVKLDLSVLARRYGKPAPKLTVTDTLPATPGGPPAPRTLAAMQGKWTLFEFWGWWCPPCVQSSLPEAVKFYEEFAEKRDRFEIVAFHGPNADSAADLLPKLRAIEKKEWKGRPLPFPILIDKSGATVRDWGVTVYPSAVLIDPQGRVVRGGSLKLLGEKLRAEKPTAG